MNSVSQAHLYYTAVLIINIADGFGTKLLEAEIKKGADGFGMKLLEAEIKKGTDRL